MDRLKIETSVLGQEKLARGLGYAPTQYLLSLKDWLKDERALLLGGKNSKGTTKRGYREILKNKRRKVRHSKRAGTWAPQIVGLFKGFVPFARDIDGLYMKAGVGIGRSKNQMQRALIKLQDGGAITSTKMMPVPIYKNLAARDITKGFHKGKVFKRLMMQDKLVAIKKNGRMFFFDKEARAKRGNRYLRKGLLFIGQKRIRVKRQFTGRYDFYSRFYLQLPGAYQRGQRVVDTTTKRVERRIASGR